MTPERLSLVGLPGIPAINPGDDLARIVVMAATNAGGIADGDVIVIAQKIVSKAEGRIVDLAGIDPSAGATELAQKTGKDPRIVELVLRESEDIVRYREGVLIAAHKSGLVLANAGIDRSNVSPPPNAEIAPDSEFVLLLPVDSDLSASRLQSAIQDQTGCRVGIIINDSLGRAWRNGTIGTAIGAAGLTTLLDRNGSPDMEGRPLQATQIARADELAAAASIVMGQGDEARPVVIIRGFTGDPGDGRAADLVRLRDQDLFR